MARAPKNWGLLIFLVVIGSIFGSFLGQAFQGYLPVLNYGESIGLSPTNINLSVLTITFGVTLKLNIASILGFFAALFVYARL
ncbi:MAG: DUF4321 domain-containing protein [Firmicutes bacterium]|nr:DUF4321 domain-containing protein [Bacillota bacterium]